MLKIAICDDSTIELNKLEEIVRNILKKHGAKIGEEDLCLDKYKDATQLVKQLEQGNLYQIYFLDIVMPEISGIELGNRIREKQKYCSIIYTTSSAEFALDAYSLQAQRYLLKPIQEPEVLEALDYSFQIFDREKEKEIAVKTAGGTVNLALADIEYFECSARTIKVHLFKEDLIESQFIRQSFEKEVKEAMEDNRFVQIHKSYIVNMEYISVFSSTDLTLKSGAILPISKAKLKTTKHTYMEYCKSVKY